MPETYTDKDGNEVEAVPMQEVQKIQEERDAIAKERDDLAAEKARLEAGGQDKDENFQKLRTKLEGTETQLGELTKRLSDKETYEKTSIKNTLINHFAGADEESRKKLQAEYDLINIDESTPENIGLRMEKAAKVSGLYKETGGSNPVFGGWGGAAPLMKPTQPAGDDADNIVNSDKGRSALGAMGIPVEEKK